MKGANLATSKPSLLAYSDFKWQGWSNGGKNQNPPKIRRASLKNPKKSLDQKINPEKSYAEFLSLKNFHI